MPLKILEARNAKTKNLYIRGSYLGVRVDTSCRTDRRPLARQILKRIEGEIERGEYQKAVIFKNDPTFVEAAANYLDETPRRKKLVNVIKKLVKYFGETPLPEIDQNAIDEAARLMLPNGTPMSRCASVHMPVSAILHHAKVDITIHRPKGWQGKERTEWLVREDAFGIIKAADTFDPEFATLLTWLLYTGARIGAALDLRRQDVRLDHGRAKARNQKNQPHIEIELHADLAERLKVLMASHDREHLFRLHHGGHLGYQLIRAKLTYLGIPCPRRPSVGWRQPPNRLSWCTFHSFRHTWATWMRHAGTDVQGLIATGNWRDASSATRYAHAMPQMEWQRVHSLPSMSGRSVGKERGPRQTLPLTH